MVGSAFLSHASIHIILSIAIITFSSATDTLPSPTPTSPPNQAPCGIEPFVGQISLNADSDGEGFVGAFDLVVITSSFLRFDACDNTGYVLLSIFDEQNVVLDFQIPNCRVPGSFNPAPTGSRLDISLPPGTYLVSVASSENTVNMTTSCLQEIDITSCGLVPFSETMSLEEDPQIPGAFAGTLFFTVDFPSYVRIDACNNPGAFVSMTLLDQVASIMTQQLPNCGEQQFVSLYTGTVLEEFLDEGVYTLAIIAMNATVHVSVSCFELTPTPAPTPVISCGVQPFNGLVSLTPLNEPSTAFLGAIQLIVFADSYIRFDACNNTQLTLLTVIGARGQQIISQMPNCGPDQTLTGVVLDVFLTSGEYSVLFSGASNNAMVDYFCLDSTPTPSPTPTQVVTECGVLPGNETLALLSVGQGVFQGSFVVSVSTDSVVKFDACRSDGFPFITIQENDDNEIGAVYSNCGSDGQSQAQVTAGLAAGNYTILVIAIVAEVNVRFECVPFATPLPTTCGLESFAGPIVPIETEEGLFTAEVMIEVTSPSPVRFDTCQNAAIVALTLSYDNGIPIIAQPPNCGPNSPSIVNSASIEIVLDPGTYSLFVITSAPEVLLSYFCFEPLPPATICSLAASSETIHLVIGDDDRTFVGQLPLFVATNELVKIDACDNSAAVFLSLVDSSGTEVVSSIHMCPTSPGAFLELELSAGNYEVVVQSSVSVVTISYNCVETLAPTPTPICGATPFSETISLIGAENGEGFVGGTFVNVLFPDYFRFSTCTDTASVSMTILSGENEIVSQSPNCGSGALVDIGLVPGTYFITLFASEPLVDLSYNCLAPENKPPCPVTTFSQSISLEEDEEADGFVTTLEISLAFRGFIRFYTCHNTAAITLFLTAQNGTEIASQSPNCGTGAVLDVALRQGTFNLTVRASEPTINLAYYCSEPTPSPASEECGVTYFGDIIPLALDEEGDGFVGGRDLVLTSPETVRINTCLNAAFVSVAVMLDTGETVASQDPNCGAGSLLDVNLTEGTYSVIVRASQEFVFLETTCTPPQICGITEIDNVLLLGRDEEGDGFLLAFPLVVSSGAQIVRVDACQNSATVSIFLTDSDNTQIAAQSPNCGNGASLAIALVQGTYQVILRASEPSVNLKILCVDPTPTPTPEAFHCGVDSFSQDVVLSTVPDEGVFTGQVTINVEFSEFVRIDTCLNSALVAFTIEHSDGEQIGLELRNCGAGTFVEVLLPEGEYQVTISATERKIHLAYDCTSGPTPTPEPARCSALEFVEATVLDIDEEADGFLGRRVITVEGQSSLRIDTCASEATVTLFLLDSQGIEIHSESPNCGSGSFFVVDLQQGTYTIMMRASEPFVVLAVFCERNAQPTPTPDNCHVIPFSNTLQLSVDEEGDGFVGILLMSVSSEEFIRIDSCQNSAAVSLQLQDLSDAEIVSENLSCGAGSLIETTFPQGDYNIIVRASESQVSLAYYCAEPSPPFVCGAREFGAVITLIEDEEGDGFLGTATITVDVSAFIRIDACQNSATVTLFLYDFEGTEIAAQSPNCDSGAFFDIGLTAGLYGLLVRASEPFVTINVYCTVPSATPLPNTCSISPLDTEIEAGIDEEGDGFVARVSVALEQSERIRFETCQNSFAVSIRILDAFGQQLASQDPNCGAGSLIDIDLDAGGYTLELRGSDQLIKFAYNCIRVDEIPTPTPECGLTASRETFALNLLSDEEGDGFVGRIPITLTATDYVLVNACQNAAIVTLFVIDSQGLEVAAESPNCGTGSILGTELQQGDYGIVLRASQPFVNIAYGCSAPTPIPTPDQQCGADRFQGLIDLIVDEEGDGFYTTIPLTMLSLDHIRIDTCQNSVAASIQLLDTNGEEIAQQGPNCGTGSLLDVTLAEGLYQVTVRASQSQVAYAVYCIDATPTPAPTPSLGAACGVFLPTAPGGAVQLTLSIDEEGDGFVGNLPVSILGTEYLRIDACENFATVTLFVLNAQGDQIAAQSPNCGAGSVLDITLTEGTYGIVIRASEQTVSLQVTCSEPTPTPEAQLFCGTSEFVGIVNLVPDEEGDGFMGNEFVDVSFAEYLRVDTCQNSVAVSILIVDASGSQLANQDPNCGAGSFVDIALIPGRYQIVVRASAATVNLGIYCVTPTATPIATPDCGVVGYADTLILNVDEEGDGFMATVHITVFFPELVRFDTCLSAATVTLSLVNNQEQVLASESPNCGSGALMTVRLAQGNYVLVIRASQPSVHLAYFCGAPTPTPTIPPTSCGVTPLRSAVTLGFDEEGDGYLTTLIVDVSARDRIRFDTCQNTAAVSLAILDSNGNQIVLQDSNCGAGALVDVQLDQGTYTLVVRASSDVVNLAYFCFAPTPTATPIISRNIRTKFRLVLLGIELESLSTEALQATTEGIANYLRIQVIRVSVSRLDKSMPRYLKQTNQAIVNVEILSNSLDEANDIARRLLSRDASAALVAAINAEWQQRELSMSTSAASIEGLSVSQEEQSSERDGGSDLPTLVGLAVGVSVAALVLGMVVANSIKKRSGTGTKSIISQPRFRKVREGGEMEGRGLLGYSQFEPDTELTDVGVEMSRSKVAEMYDEEIEDGEVEDGSSGSDGNEFRVVLERIQADFLEE